MAADGAARDEFEATYGVMLGRFWRYVSAATGLGVVGAQVGGADLRGGRAAGPPSVLPRFAAAEDAARLAEVMSFALAAAVVTIPVNEGGWLHNVAGEAYVVVPDGFEAFAAVDGVAAKTVRNRVARLGRHRERGSTSGAANTFRAELADGRRVEGMVFPGEMIWDGDPPAEADGALGRRRR